MSSDRLRQSYPVIAPKSTERAGVMRVFNPR
jgi:hypothetical protein